MYKDTQREPHNTKKPPRKKQRKSFVLRLVGFMFMMFMLLTLFVIGVLGVTSAKVAYYVIRLTEELPTKYEGWELLHHLEDIFQDQHPGGIRHEHAYERIIARKIRT